MLDIYAGKSALKIISEEGFKQALFTSFLGASGGPKWFSLYNLDKYVFGDFFAERKCELNLIGSSAGAFRIACFTQNDPISAITRMAESYSETVYSDKADRDEITSKANELLDYMLGDTGIEEILSNSVFKAHFLVNRANGFVGSENKVLQSFGLVKSYLLNRVDRKYLHKQYDRLIFQYPSSTVMIDDYCNIHTENIDLTRSNLRNALLASGSIPMVMKGIKDIEGAGKGTYRDGGIVDYHFDFKIQNKGLVLYPHFNSVPKAGWFDKNLKRKVQPKNYDNIVMLIPSAKFIDSLPYSKIPDRTDFSKMESDQRIKYWKTVLSETEKLSHHFNEFLEAADFSNIKLIR